MLHIQPEGDISLSNKHLAQRVDDLCYSIHRSGKLAREVNGTSPDKDFYLLVGEICARILGYTWQPIKTAPRDGTGILVRRGHFSTSVGTEATKVYFNRDACEAEETWMICDTPIDVYVLNPTEWMPLPK